MILRTIQKKKMKCYSKQEVKMYSILMNSI